MPQNTAFPAFLSIEYDARGVGFPAFEKDATRTFDKVEARGKNIVASFDEIGRAIAGAIKRGGSGDIDLGIDKFQKAAAEAASYEKVLLKLSAALKSTAVAREPTFSDPFTVQIEQAKRATAAAQAQVVVYKELQAVLDKLTASSRVNIDQRSSLARFTAGDASLDRAAISARTLDDILGRVSVKSRALAADTDRFNQLQTKSAKEANALALELERQSKALQLNVSALDRFLAGQASLDRAAVSGTTLNDVLRRTSTTAPEQRTQFDPQAMARAEQAAKQYAQALFNIRQQVDPAYFAQKRFNQELAFADHALKSGDISATQYAQRLAHLRGEMALNATSTRQMRFASVQMGQQLQDVVIQAQMGTNAFVILAQQGSQMAFALTEAGGTVGKLARAMAGWQGAIVFAGVAIAGQLIPALLGMDEKSKDANRSTIDFSNSIVAATGLVGNYTTAIEQLSKATRGLINTQALIIDNTQTFAQNATSQLQSQLAQLDAQIGKLNAKNPITDFLFNANQNAIQLAKLQRERAAIASNLQDAQKALAQAQTAMEARRANEAADPKGAQQAEIERKRARLLERRQYTLEQGPVPLQDANQSMLISEADFNREMQGLKRREDALRKNESASKAIAAANAQARLEERGKDTAKKIANITDRFSDMPPQVRTVNAALRELDDLADDFSRKKPPNYEAIKKAIDDAKAAIRENGLDQPVNDLLESMQQQLKIGALQAQGKVAEAASLQQILQLERQRGQLSDAQVADIVAANEALRQQTRELEKQQAYQRTLLNFVQAQRDAVNDLVYNLLSGKGLNSIGGFVKGIFNSYLRALSDEITNKLTYDFFQKQTDKIKGETKLSDAGARMAKSVDLLKAALDDLRKSVKGAAGDIADAGDQATTGAANDNDIVVTGRKSVSGTLKDGLKDLGKSIFGEKAATKFGEIASKGMQGAAIGTATSGILKSLGIKQSKTGAQIGGAIGSFLPIPGGEIIGSIIGGTIGGLFKKTKWGSVTVNSGGVSAGSGNSKSAIGAAVQAGGAFNTQLQQIADALGGKIGDFGNITIGQRHGDWRVNTGGASLKVKKGAVDFNGDGEAAIAYAVNEAIQRGAVTGLRAGTNNLLKASGELQDKLSKALSFENVFRELNKLKDPVGAAISDLNLEYKKLIDIFKQANATVGETAQLEELYNLKRKAAVEDAIKQVAGSLQDLYKNLTIGDNGYSLRTRLNNAKAAYDPLAARVAAGDTTAYNDFAAAAQTIIDLQREYSGSAPEYFAVLDQVTKLTKGEIDRQQAALSSANASASPFDTTPIVDATQQQTTAIVNALANQTQIANDNSQQVIAAIRAYFGNGAGARFNF
jgi:hypothetical protein